MSVQGKARSKVNRKAGARAILAAAMIALSVVVAPAASAAAPGNDDFANAISISALPFSDSVDLSEATLEPSEPQQYFNTAASVWYSISPTSDQKLRADMAGSNFSDTLVNVYQQTSSGFGGLMLVTGAGPGLTATFSARAGNTYYLQAQRINSIGGTLKLDVSVVPPPANDDFAHATVIASLPFSDTVDARGATVESSEPSPTCGYVSQTSVWYAFTPSATTSYSASSAYYYASNLAVYTGSALDNLHQIACGVFGSQLTFRGSAGTTYYFQVESVSFDPTSLQLSLDVTPPPVAALGFSPGDPSSFDNVQFSDQSYDPGQAGIQSEAWTFGDGGSGTGCCPTHRYAKDGDYTARLTVTTPDGRTASTTQKVHVQTHDVVISKLSVPNSASPEQTKAITVGVVDNRYPETVQVQLFKSTANGFELFGTLTQSVPVRGMNKPTTFSFNYTFTSGDQGFGKVTFQAIASIVGARDALQADNTAISLPTSVK